MPPLLRWDSFEVHYSGGPTVGPLTDTLAPGERLGLAGESGCGKTTVLEYLAGLRRGGVAIRGECHAPAAASIGYVPQDPLQSLSPFLSVGEQVRHVAPSAAVARSWMARVGLGSARHWDSRPHQLSGGERQRVLIAQAAAASPQLLIADEPVAHLDEASQDLILSLLDEALSASGAALVVASHQESVFTRLGCRVRRLTPAPLDEMADQPRAVRSEAAVVRVAELSKSFAHRGWLLGARHRHRALDSISLVIAPGETLALAGASGSGKSTLARCLAGREKWDAGTVEFAPARRAQLVAQEPSASLNPRQTVREALAEATSEPPGALLEELDLAAALADRPCGALSEGQRARVAIARALAAAGGGLLILDESLASLDEGTARQITSAVAARQQRLGLACLLITHDSRLAGRVAHRRARLSAGRLAL